MAESRAKKTNLACDSCRRRKRKCDGRTPICSLCEKGNIECVYDATLDQRRPAQKNYVAALEARVAQLEGILRDAGASDVPGPSGVSLIDESVEPTPQQTRAASPTIPSTTSTEPVAQPELDAEPKYVPADGAVEALKLMAEPQVQRDPVTVTEELDLGMEGCDPLVNFATEHKLLAQFWDWQRMHLPYVAPVPFLSAYAIHSEAVHPDEPIPPPPPPPPPNPFAGPTAIGVPRASDVPITPDLPHFISPLLLDCMFAVAALFHGNSETSQLFYDRAKPKMLEEVAKPCLATVQAVLLMATWELGHARAPAAWTLSGVAVALCVRLGMNVDASPLVRSGAMSKRLFETRNFVFWAAYNFDRFYATCMGMHPLMDRRTISTPRHSSLATANVADAGKPIETASSVSASTFVAGPKSLGAPPEKPTASDVAVSWWSPSTLGMGDVLVQAAWEAVRDLIRITDMLFDGIYAFNAPKRTPQENLELVTRNNLAIQRFLDELPTWLRSTGAIRRKDNGLVYLHLCVHLTSILASRPFMSERPHPEEPSQTDPTIPSSQPTQSSQITRRYRTLAFRVARASALQVMSLIRHIPLSSPCVTLPYIVYSASTILLLCPDDLAAMDAVRTGIACLEVMHETGYWVESARDACDRVKALARRWGVVIAPSKRVLGPVGNTSGPGGGSGSGGAGGSGSGNHDNSDQSSGAPGSSSEASSNLPSNAGSGAGSTATTRPPTSAGTRHTLEGHAHYAAQHPPSMVPDIPTGYQEVPAASEHVDVLSQLYAAQIYTGELVPDPNQNQLYPDAPQMQDVTPSQAPLSINPSQGYTGLEPQDYASANPTQGYTSAPPSQIPEQYHTTSFTHTSESIQPTHEPTGSHAYIPAQQPTQFTAQAHAGDTQLYSQPLDDISSYLQSEPTSHAPHLQYARDPLAARRRQELQRQQQYEESQYRQASSSRTQAHPYHRPSQLKPRKIPHVAYALSHAEPEHDSHLPHTHWHAVLPADLTLPFPPDPIACMDTAACFAHTIEHTQDPAFLDSGPDPFASVALDWLADSSCSFPAMTLDMYAGSNMSQGQTIYAREAGDPYGGGYGHGGGYSGGYGGSGGGM